MRDGVERRAGAYLPHWRYEGGVYAVTFRLGDSLPRVALARIAQLRAELDGVRARDPSMRVAIDAWRVFHQKQDEYLNAGHGACYFRDPEYAGLMQATLLHFDGVRYNVWAWVVMPNHVHVVVKPRPGFELSKIVQSWKGFSAHTINRMLSRTGSVWAVEYYDHLIRGPEDLTHQVGYIAENPRAAGLTGWRWMGERLPWSSEGMTGA